VTERNGGEPSRSKKGESRYASGTPSHAARPRERFHLDPAADLHGATAEPAAQTPREASTAASLPEHRTAPHSTAVPHVTAPTTNYMLGGCGGKGPARFTVAHDGDRPHP
jgi:hypothetical protein